MFCSKLSKKQVHKNNSIIKCTTHTQYINLTKKNVIRKYQINIIFIRVHTGAIISHHLTSNIIS